jgi:hypothetical protein
MPLDDLLAIVYEYYPRHLSHGDPEHNVTAQTQRLLDARQRAWQGRAVWDTFTARMRGRHPDLGFEDASYLQHDACFWLRMSTTPVNPSTKAWTVVGVCVSVIAPLYVVYVSHMRDVDGIETADVCYEPDADARPLYDEMTREVEATFGYRPVPPKLGLVRVPDVQLDPHEAGEATLYDCLFTSALR